MKPHLLVYLDQAHDYYSEEYHAFKNRERFHYVKNLKYFGALKKHYLGMSTRDVSIEMDVSYETVKRQFRSVQNKIEMYVKLKDMGRL